MLLNFTVQDTLHMLLAVLLFPTVLVFPGYVTGWALNIFSFKQRTIPAQYAIAIALSNSIIPVVLFFAFRFVSNQFGIGIIVAFFAIWIAIQIKLAREHRLHLKIIQEHKTAFIIGIVWVIFCVLLLVDIQIGQKLYFNSAAYDFTTRTALIEAVTQTGIPPINPTYYPGHFERITELYYFWYILGSVVNSIGGRWVDARAALFAGITWGGLSLMATVATYLRIRSHQKERKVSRASILGIQLLAVSGLDFIPVISFMIAAKIASGNLPFDGLIEGWNLPIMSWLNALTWVPNHISGLIACMVAMLAIISAHQTTKSNWVINVLLAGVSLASAFGLSLWMVFTFGIFMAIWAIWLLFQKDQRSLLVAVLAAGSLGLIVASPFLADILRSGGKSGMTGAFPLGLYVRHFSFSKALPHGMREVVSALLLPINYFFELGFFFTIAVLWVRKNRKSENWSTNSFWKAEMLLLVTVVILLSFVKSTVIALNDLGMRAWLLGQFILIIWAVDIFNTSSEQSSWLTLSAIKAIPVSKRVSDLLSILLIVGIMTTALEGIVTRFWTILIDNGVAGVPNELSLDTNLGERTYDGRLAYEYIRDHTPQNLVVQSNPTIALDRPSGLYGTRQMVISDRTMYGVPMTVFKDMSTSIGRIFLAENMTDWASTDEICSQYFIQAIIVNDADPLWSSLPTLKEQRVPLYINRRYAVFPCGNGN